MADIIRQKDNSSMKLIFEFIYSTVHPLIKVHDQLVITRLGSKVSLQCSVEASPKAVHFWIKKGNRPGDEGKNFQIIFVNAYIFFNNFFQKFLSIILTDDTD